MSKKSVDLCIVSVIGLLFQQNAQYCSRYFWWSSYNYSFWIEMRDI